MLFEKVKTIICDYFELDEDEVNLETTFAEIGADSLDMVDLAMDIEDVFNVEVTEEALEKFVSVDDVIKFIADNIKKNIRQIEGIIKRIKAYQDVEGIKINLPLAKRAISDIINDSQPLPVTGENIINEVSRTFNVSAADIRSDKRNANISQARQVAIYIVDQVTGLSLKSIGSEFGNKHHSTIIYALKEIKGKLEKDVALKSTVDDIIKNINEN